MSRTRRVGRSRRSGRHIGCSRRARCIGSACAARLALFTRVRAQRGGCACCCDGGGEQAIAIATATAVAGSARERCGGSYRRVVRCRQRRCGVPHRGRRVVLYRRQGIGRARSVLRGPLRKACACRIGCRRCACHVQRRVGRAGKRRGYRAGISTGKRAGRQCIDGCVGWDGRCDLAGADSWHAEVCRDDRLRRCGGCHDAADRRVGLRGRGRSGKVGQGGAFRGRREGGGGRQRGGRYGGLTGRCYEGI